ncbi:MAG: GNAT family N-acetyltransferase [Oscillospiraceae bacterium]|nr:GNAT family N-acetyltransferase [Oscillospiraceae bacterium]
MIRQADKQDIPRIAEIIVFGKRVAYRPIFENDYVSFNELQVVNLYEEYKSNPDRLDGMLLYDDGIVKGVINGQPIDDKTIEITDFYVDPFFIRQGIGTLLIEYLIQQVRKKGIHKIVLWVIKDNVKARKFYESNGFVNSGKTRIIEGTTKEDCCYEYVLE